MCVFDYGRILMTTIMSMRWEIQAKKKKKLIIIIGKKKFSRCRRSTCVGGRVCVDCRQKKKIFLNFFKENRPAGRSAAIVYRSLLLLTVKRFRVRFSFLIEVSYSSSSSSSSSFFFCWMKTTNNNSNSNNNNNNNTESHEDQKSKKKKKKKKSETRIRKI